jgi:hypothetical protein
MIAALETLMGEMGDMHISISALWLERLIRRAGVPYEIYDHEEPREVDATALSALCVLARRNCSLRIHDEVAPATEWTPERGAPGAYRVGHSKLKHVADGMVAMVEIGDGAVMTIPNPMSGHHGSVGWHLTWGNVHGVKQTAVSLIESYKYLLSGSINMTEATSRLRLMRNAYRSLCKEARR